MRALDYLAALIPTLLVLVLGWFVWRNVAVLYRRRGPR